MNESQEAILDTLMVADRIGDRWKPGPLPLALDVLQNAGLTRRHEPGPALGYPPLLCVAIEGAATTIRNVDDCRTLGISLFTEIAPRKRVPRLKDRQFVAAILWSIRRVPSFYTPKTGKAEVANLLAEQLSTLLQEYLAGQHCQQTTITYLDNRLARAIDAANSHGKDFVPERLSLSALYFALHTLRRASNNEDAEANACLVTRDVGRLAGLVNGPTAAVPYCVELARKIGM